MPWTLSAIFIQLFDAMIFILIFQSMVDGLEHYLPDVPHRFFHLLLILVLLLRRAAGRFCFLFVMLRGVVAHELGMRT